MQTQPLAAPACARDAGSWCAEVWQLTGQPWLARSADWLVATPLRIVFIFLIAFLVRWLAHRLVRRMTTPQAPGGRLLGGLRKRVPQRLGEQWDEAWDKAWDKTLWTERRRQRAQTIASLLRSSVSLVVFSLAVIISLGELGVNLAPLIASAGVVGVAVGFGARNLVADFLSGMFMLLEDQYGVGDVIDIGEATGTVEAIGLRVTTLRDIAGTVWYVRNGEVTRVGNSSQNYAVAVVDLPVGPQADVPAALALLAERAAAITAAEPLSEDVLAEPEVLGVEQVSAEALLLRTTVRVRAGRQWAVQRTLRAGLSTALREAGFPAPSTGYPPPPSTAN